jgi:hypothetical protein
MPISLLAVTVKLPLYKVGSNEESACNGPSSNLTLALNELNGQLHTLGRNSLNKLIEPDLSVNRTLLEQPAISHSVD